MCNRGSTAHGCGEVKENQNFVIYNWEEQGFTAFKIFSIFNQLGYCVIVQVNNCDQESNVVVLYIPDFDSLEGRKSRGT